MKTKFFVAFLATLFFAFAISQPAFVFAEAANEERPTADSFGVEDASGKSGTYVEVPVSITNVRNGPIQGIRLGVDYDESVLDMTSISKVDLTSSWIKRLGEDRHTMLIVTYDAAIQNGSSGSVVLLNFSVIGSPGDTSTMNMSFIELSNFDAVVGRTTPARNGTFTVTSTVTSTAIFDTGQENPYPSISGIHYGSIILNQTMVVNKLFTYSCPGTGGHSEYVAFYNTTTGEEIANGTWNGYSEDWHNITFKEPFVLQAGTSYNYTQKTGSYPQIIHTSEYNATGGKITCTKFTDANGEEYYNGIAAIRLF